MSVYSFDLFLFFQNTDLLECPAVTALDKVRIYNLLVI